MHRSTVTRYVAALKESGWDEMDVDQRRKWIEQSWAKRNDARAREHRLWVKNGGPQAAKLRQAPVVRQTHRAGCYRSHETLEEKQRRASNAMAQIIEVRFGPKADG
jgi:hypothetical protein